MATGLENGDVEVYREVDLYGEFHFKVDAKGRIVLPSKFRKVLPNELVVSLELENDCLYVFEPDAFNRWITRLFDDKFGGYDASNKQHVMLRSKLKSRADVVEVDSSGRVVLRPDMRDAVNIDKDVVLVGNTGYFEVWDEKAFAEQSAKVDLGIFYSRGC